MKQIFRILLILTAVHITACAGPQTSVNQWLGHDQDELIASLGPPDEMYTAAPMYSRSSYGQEAVSWVYLPDKSAGQTVIEVYVIATETGEIIDYKER